MRCGVTLDQIADADSYISHAGNTVHKLYSSVLRDGRIELEESGAVSIPDFINAYAEFTDMAYIISRLNAGDASPLSAATAFYGDVSMMHNDRRDLMQSVLDCRAMFDNLPDVTRAKFGDDFATWIGQAGTQDWIDKMIVKAAAPEAAPAPVEQAAT